MKRIVIMIISVVLCVSCNKGEYESDKDTLTSFATINVEDGKSYLIPDGGGSTMYITKTSVNKKELTHQRRVIATYTLLKDVTPQNLADHTYWNVRLNQIEDLTCKPPVLKSQIENPDQLGTGVLSINNVRFTANYLNIEYEHADGNPDINLWFDDDNHPNSNTWITSLCIHKTGASDAKIKGYVSFELGKLFRETIERLYELNANEPAPSKLILRYYESDGKQKELNFTIRYYEYGPQLSLE